MGYVAQTFIAGEQPTTAKWNILWSNDSSFNDGTGIGAGAINTAAIATGIQLIDKSKNPYKFWGWRNAAMTSSNSPLKIPFDSKVFDTGTNFDIVTNQGRFTAPVAGFYFFNALGGNTVATSVSMNMQLYKNGSSILFGSAVNPSNAGNIEAVNGLIQLSTSDYVEAYFTGGNGSVMYVGQSLSYMQGFMVSGT